MCGPGYAGESHMPMCPRYSTTHPCFVSQPCLNGGTCYVLSRDAYECSCQVGFTGNKVGLRPLLSYSEQVLLFSIF
ncbi:Notch-like protein 2 N-terminal-like protein C [Camelus dromedarius]|uniref:Notch-like protein 2 N-terminal-like protein C n=1 Tax=Camelus dromedarius TaxID=9838 RepID=A0A5N4DV18_CAMDR|nr:Notch-like protein 2 N-terminal-like protein C [Camelus dromedarius]